MARQYLSRGFACYYDSTHKCIGFVTHEERASTNDPWLGVCINHCGRINSKCEWHATKLKDEVQGIGHWFKEPNVS